LPIEYHSLRPARGLDFRNKRRVVSGIPNKVSIMDVQEARLPEEQRAERITLHDTVKKEPNLVPLPHEVTLKIWQYYILIADFV